MSRPVRLLSYNIRKAVGLDGRRKPGRILDVINKNEADIVLLQEADKRLGPRPAALDHRLIEAASDYYVAPLAANDVSLGWHGNAILLRKGLTMHRTDRLDLPGLEPRGAVLAEVSTPESEPVMIVGAHLGLLRPWRRRQLAQIARSLAKTGAARSIVGGDFNEWSDDQGLEALTGSHDIIAPGKTFHSNRPLAALDRLAHGAEIAADGAGVDESALARISSDHLPIWADFHLPLR
ncbi:MAG: endonuclease/exonuclease/phosphatase family protein [Pseudomonadota bacterium]